MLLQSYNNLIMKYIIDNFKSELFNIENNLSIIIIELINLIKNQEIDKETKEKIVKQHSLYLNIKYDKEKEEELKKEKKEFINILFNRILYNDIFLSNEELKNEIEKYKEDIIKYLNLIIKINFYK